MVNENNRQEIDIKSKEQLLAEAEELHQRFKQSLVVKRIDVASISTTAKTPFKALLLREALFYRTTELTGVAIDLHRQTKIVASVVIIKAIFETVALCYYVYKHLEKAVETGCVGETDEMIMRAGHGGKVDPTFPQAFNALTTIGKLDKEYNGTQGMYDIICEIAHPNWMGCEGSYSKTNYDDYYVEFSQEYEHVPPQTGLNELMAALNIFEHYYNIMGEIFPKFTQIWESFIDKRMAKLKKLIDQSPPELRIGLYYDADMSCWAICTKQDGLIVSGCAIDDSDQPQLTTEYNEHLEAAKANDNLIFITDNVSLS